MNYYIGVMSGTSLDGIDVVIAEFDKSHLPHIEAAETYPFTSELRYQLQQLITNGYCELQQLGQLDIQTGHQYAEHINNLLRQTGLSARDIAAIGCHGQTIFHAPDVDYPFSMQIGNGNVIAEHTGITTVTDFRQRDMVLGGQGAPLVPAFHEALFRQNGQDRVVVNIGGISNITVLPADPEQAVFGFDTGPGNTLMDSWIQSHHAKTYDENGHWAATGQVYTALLDLLLSDEYFSRPIPKSTGRERFHIDWLQNHLNKVNRDIAAEDVQATLLQLTAISIATNIKQYAPDSRDIFVCGGGAHNDALMQALKTALSPATVTATDQIGMNSDWVEATAFAWLARQTLHHQTGNLPAVTGASHATILGAIYPSFNSAS